jgi:predicted RNase H-like HicB family nuclease
MRFRIVLEQDPATNDWAAWVPELPGCTSAGVTDEEALAGIREAIELYLRPDPIELEPGAIIREITA